MLNSYCVLSDVLSFGGTTVNRPGKVMSPCLYSTGHLGVGKVGEGWRVRKDGRDKQVNKLRNTTTSPRKECYEKTNRLTRDRVKYNFCLYV